MLKGKLVVLFALALILVFGLTGQASARVCLLVDDNTGNTENIILDLVLIEYDGSHIQLIGKMEFEVLEPADNLAMPVLGSGTIVNGMMEIHLVGSDIDNVVGGNKQLLRFSRIHLTLDPVTYNGTGRGYIQTEGGDYYYNIGITKIDCQ